MTAQPALRPVSSVWRNHNCARKHRTFATLAKCMWNRGTIWVNGEGPYATVSECGKGGRWPFRTIMLHGSLEEAQATCRTIDATACGHACHRAHRIIELVLP